MAFSNEYSMEESARVALESNTGAMLLEFGHSSCGKCRRAQPLIMEAIESHPSVRHLKIEHLKGSSLGRAFGVKLWPTLIFLFGEQEIARTVRPTSTTEVAEALALIDPR